MKLAKHLLLAVVALISTAANATVVTYSDSFYTYTNASGSTSGSYTSGSQTVTDYVNLQGFDSSLGTLTGVDISFTSTWNLSSQISARDYTRDVYSTYSYRCGGSWWTGYRYCTGYNYTNDTWGQANAYSDLTVNLTDPSGSTTHLSSSLTSYCSAYSSCGDYDSTGNASFNTTLNLSSIDINAFVKSPGDTIDLNFVNDKDINVYCDNNDAGDYCTGSAYGSWYGNVTVATPMMLSFLKMIKAFLSQEYCPC